MHIVVFPYLPLCQTATIGGWRLVPAQQADDTALFIDDDARLNAEGLLRLYGAGAGAPIAGALGAPPGGQVGDDVPISQVATLRRATVVGLLEGNPVPPAMLEDPESADATGGWNSATSDNAALWVNDLDASGYTAREYGAMVPTLSGGHNALDEDSVPIRRPAEVPSPIMYGVIDAQYSDAMFRVLVGGGELSRRLARAIDWLDLAWRNSPVTPEVRIGLLRTGFEVLFGSDNRYTVRDALGALLNGETLARLERSWLSRTNQTQTAALSDLEWWFMQFAFLRNAIMHGDAHARAMFEHEGRPHVWSGEAWLRKAIRASLHVGHA